METETILDSIAVRGLEAEAVNALEDIYQVLEQCFKDKRNLPEIKQNLLRCEFIFSEKFNFSKFDVGYRTLLRRERQRIGERIRSSRFPNASDEMFEKIMALDALMFYADANKNTMTQLDETQLNSLKPIYRRQLRLEEVCILINENNICEELCAFFLSNYEVVRALVKAHISGKEDFSAEEIKADWSLISNLIPGTSKFSKQEMYYLVSILASSNLSLEEKRKILADLEPASFKLFAKDLELSQDERFQLNTFWNEFDMGLATDPCSNARRKTI